MGKPKYDHPTSAFPYKISKRLNIMSTPKYSSTKSDGEMPAVTETGVRKSALRGKASDRVNEAAYPFIRMYKSRFSKDRIAKIDKMIEAANTTIYTKLANAAIDLKKGDKNAKDGKKKKPWSESDWKKHMERINQIAEPKKIPEPEPISRGEIISIEAILPRLMEMAQAPESKIYRRLSQEDWYRDPIKVQQSALTYVITERVKKLAAPRGATVTVQ